MSFGPAIFRLQSKRQLVCRQERLLEEQRKEKERKAELKKKPQIEKVEDPAIKAELEAQQERAKASRFLLVCFFKFTYLFFVGSA